MDWKHRSSGVWVRGGLAIAITSVVNVALAALLAEIVGASSEFLALQPGPVATATIVPMLVGTTLFVILRRTVRRPARVFAVLASSVAVLSLIAPISLSLDTSGAFAGSTPAAALSLIPLHLIPAVALVAALTWHRKEVGP